MTTNSPNANGGSVAEQLQKENVAFALKAKEALTELFEAARQKNELQFTLSLIPELRGSQGTGWNSAYECLAVIEDYIPYLEKTPDTSRLRVRVALGFYCHLAEASGFYEIPKNMLGVTEGKNHNLRPFNDLVEIHRATGEAIAPNANKIMKDLVGHSSTAGFKKLSEVFRDLFDSELRNAFAHADYVVWMDGIRLTKRNGGIPKVVSYDIFSSHVTRAITFFSVLAVVREKFLNDYNPSRTFRGRLADSPEQECTVSYDPQNGLSIVCR